VSVDLRVLAFAAGVSVATAVLFGLAPALRTAGGDVGGALKSSTRSATSGRGASRARSALVVAEVAVSLVLVAQAGLLLRSFMNVQAEAPGFQPDGLWTVPLAPTGIETPEQYVSEMEEIRASLAGVPGVTSATHGLTLPFEFTGGGRCCWNQPGWVDGEERPEVRLALHPVTGEYFETLGLPWVAGRVWARSEEAQAPVPAVFSERLAVDLFGSAAAAMARVVGRSDRLQLRVVGVVEDTPHYGLDQTVPQAAYIPMSQVPFSIPLAHFAVRLAGEAPEGIERALREAVWSVAPDVPVPTVRPMRSWMSASLAGRRFDSALFATFGAIALLLAAAGLYGTLLYAVRQQSRELGIRLALGAARGRVEREVVSRGLTLVAVGSVIGVAASWWVGRFVESRLYEVGAADPTVLGGAVAALVFAAALASWLPARRAGRTDPLETLRAE
jgi:predicted permease